MNNENVENMPMKLLGNVIDCDNESRLADFYAELLGWTRTFSGNGYAVISSKDYPVLLVFQHVENYERPVFPPEIGKQARMAHFDIYVENLQVGIKRAVALGAVICEEQLFEGSITMFDPEGRPFCLVDNWEGGLFVK